MNIPLEIYGQLILSVVLGGAIGLERRLAHKTAGMRTFAMVSLGAAFSIEPADNPSFIKGRAACILVNKKAVGVIGELTPELLTAWNIEMPASGLELDLDELFGF